MEGSDLLVSEMFYREVVQAVLLFGYKKWVLLAAISNNLEGVYVGFLRQVTVKMAKQKRDGTWRSAAANSVLKEAGTQTPGTYIDEQQATVSDWVALRPILEVFNRGAGYEGGGSLRDPWWWQTADQKQLMAASEDILAETRARRRKSCRRGEGRGGGGVAESGSGS